MEKLNSLKSYITSRSRRSTVSTLVEAGEEPDESI